MFGHDTEFTFGPPELEWGILGLLSAIFSIQGVRYLSTLGTKVLAESTMAFVLTVLGLSGWYHFSLFLLEPFPLYRNLVLLIGFLFCPFVAWKVGTHISNGLGEPKFIQITSPSPMPPLTPTPPKLLDSSSIIDGRILSLCKTGFLQGPLLVPNCILQELQLLADSHHADKRVRGKRGLEMLSQLRELNQIAFGVPEEDFQTPLPVDEKLLNLAAKHKGILITNDWNLAQIANLRGVTTLNINELTYELRPLILPGQIIRVFIQKEGQGHGQGVAHLDDDTLVIIDHASHAIGRSVDVQVTRYKQTSTGRMIFASLLEAHAGGKAF